MRQRKACPRGRTPPPGQTPAFRVQGLGFPQPQEEKRNQEETARIGIDDVLGEVSGRNIAKFVPGPFYPFVVQAVYTYTYIGDN